MLEKTFGWLIFVILTLSIACGGRKIEERFVGNFRSSDKSEFYLDYKGRCGVIEPPRPGGSEVLEGTCSMEGNTIIMTSQKSENFIYPEFRDGKATLTADGDSFITETGRRFSKK